MGEAKSAACAPGRHAGANVYGSGLPAADGYLDAKGAKAPSIS